MVELSLTYLTGARTTKATERILGYPQPTIISILGTTL
jgi:hypothetical protein